MGRPESDGLTSLSVASILGPGGVLDDALDRYEHRPQQVEMARAVARSLRQRRPLIVEAATGTGKTLAYLIPAILSGRRVVVSTGTKALQEQLFGKDIPLLRKCLGRSFKAVLLKGRRNYLCKYRYREMERTRRFRAASDVALWPDIRAWAATTKTGDRAEVAGMPDDYATWSELSVGSEGCLGSDCEFWENCFAQEARRDAQEADLIVVNHHLFFADIALKAGGHGEVLPEYDAVIFDEAHHIEKVATEYFGVQVSNYRFRDLVGDVERALDDEEVTGARAASVRDALNAAERTSDKLFERLLKVLKPGRQGLDKAISGEVAEVLKEQCGAVDDALQKARGALRRAPLGEVGQRLAGRCAELSAELQMVLKGDDDRYAYIGERRDRGVFLQAAPIDLAWEVRSKLLESHDALIFTSATLATGGDFSFFRRRLGFDAVEAGSGEGEARPAIDVDECLLSAVFDYQEQCLLYVPRKLPAPRDPEFCKNVALIVDYLLKITEGRAFVLFTSYQNMHDVYDRLADDLEYPARVQGERSKRELLEWFRATDHAVLFATASFWEGVDVEGEGLSMVIIDKLPFANPSDPLTRARLEMVDGRGGNSFREVSLPTAAIALRQGFGRLIRSATDRGVVAVLDSRIAHKRYGRYFLQSLPPAPVVWTAPQVKRWWAKPREGGEE